MIRPLETADIPSCRDIFTDCLQDMPWRAAHRGQHLTLRRALEGQPGWVAEEQNAGIIGFLTLQVPADYVDHLFVAEDWRLCGVARGLLEVARREAEGPLSLDVDTDNITARRAYEALGWQVVASTGGGSRGRQMRLVGP
ncbi:N-acetyltransferase family protein [Hyphomonas sp.]|uniref:GNAT family N-acetyltransferase n=1 Tax=Hyphomonas sp. TaxID=87 RepID=UPI00391DA888